MRKRAKTETTNLGTFMEFQVVKPTGFPRGTRAYFHGKYVVRPDPRHGWRVDRDSGFSLWEAAVDGYFADKFGAARALELKLSGVRQTPAEGLSILGDDLAAIALRALQGKRALHLSDGNVPIRATI